MTSGLAEIIAGIFRIGYSRALNGSFRRVEIVIPKVRLCPSESELPQFPSCARTGCKLQVTIK